MGPDHKGETRDGDKSGVKVIFDILVVRRNQPCVRRAEQKVFEPRGAVEGLVQYLMRPISRRPHRRKIAPKEDQGEITPDPRTPKGKWKEREQGRVTEGLNEVNNPWTWIPAGRWKEGIETGSHRE